MDSTNHEQDTQETVTARAAMVERLLEQGMITMDSVQAAFRAVPRHLFVPADTSVEAAYCAADSVVTRRDDAGGASSSVSAPFIQARMLEMGQVGPGMRVVEIGSGGYNAALLAELVGEEGQVVSLDIDPEVTSAAQRNLKVTGYAERVSVLCADATNALPVPDSPGDQEPRWDAVLVTVGVADIPPAWIEQLAPTGRLVAPIRVNGVSRVVAFVPDGPGLRSVETEEAGFVPAQGAGERPEHTVRLSDDGGGPVELRFDTGGPADPDRLRDVLGQEPVTTWSGITMPYGTSFADLHLWAACFLPGFCRVAAGPDTMLLGQVGRDWFPYGAATGGGFGYLAARDTGDRQVEFGVHAHGPDGPELAEAYVAQIQQWDTHARHAAPPVFGFRPTGAPPAGVQWPTAVLPTVHGVITVSWPPA